VSNLKNGRSGSSVIISKFKIQPEQDATTTELLAADLLRRFHAW